MNEVHAAEPSENGQADAEDIHQVARRALAAVAAAESSAGLEEVRNRYLGRGDGLLSVHRKRIGQIPDAEARRAVGNTVNELVGRVEAMLAERQGQLDAEEEHLRRQGEKIDVTWPPPPLARGTLHPVTIVLDRMRKIFADLGYEEFESPEIEYDDLNFTMVNMPPGHPARATQATFFIDSSRLLRTHTSPGQIRALRARGAPLRVIVPGKAYRRDLDSTHFPMFHQVEGLCVAEGLSLADLKGTLEVLVRSLLGPDRALRLRPHHFPFTEPSLEVDASCMVCSGQGCKTCRFSGWIELLGSGMVHPAVLENAGVDSTLYRGFALGIGVERIAQLSFGIDDGRALYENDLRFLAQGAL